MRYPQNITLYYLVSCNLTQLLYIRIEVTRKTYNKKKTKYLFQNRQNNENPF